MDKEAYGVNFNETVKADSARIIVHVRRESES